MLKKTIKCTVHKDINLLLENNFMFAWVEHWKRESERRERERVRTQFVFMSRFMCFIGLLNAKKSEH